jgi:hypothetical protein
MLEADKERLLSKIDTLELAVKKIQEEKRK